MREWSFNTGMGCRKYLTGWNILYQGGGIIFYFQILKGGWIFVMPCRQFCLINVIKRLCSLKTFESGYIPWAWEGGLIFWCIQGGGGGQFVYMHTWGVVICSLICQAHFPDPPPFPVLNGCYHTLICNWII